MLRELLAVGLGGGLGALARHGLSRWVGRAGEAGFPFATLTVNLLGCLLIGSFLTLVEERESVSPNVRLFVSVGCLGAFTTFSTFSVETLALLRVGATWQACANVFASVACGLLAVLLGRALVLSWG